MDHADSIHHSHEAFLRHPIPKTRITAIHTGNLHTCTCPASLFTCGPLWPRGGRYGQRGSYSSPSACSASKLPASVPLVLGELCTKQVASPKSTNCGLSYVMFCHLLSSPVLATYNSVNLKAARTNLYCERLCTLSLIRRDAYLSRDTGLRRSRLN
jgi:hypothetical protein